MKAHVQTQAKDHNKEVFPDSQANLVYVFKETIPFLSPRLESTVNLFVRHLDQSGLLTGYEHRNLKWFTYEHFPKPTPPPNHNCPFVTFHVVTNNCFQLRTVAIHSTRVYSLCLTLY